MVESIKLNIIVDKTKYLEHNPDIKNSGEGFINDFIKNYEKRVNYNLDYFISDMEEPLVYDGISGYEKDLEGNWLGADVKKIREESRKISKEEFEKRFPGLSEEYIEQSLNRRMKNALKFNDELEIEYVNQYRQLQEARKKLKDM